MSSVAQELNTATEYGVLSLFTTRTILIEDCTMVRLAMNSHQVDEHLPTFGQWILVCTWFEFHSSMYLNVQFIIESTVITVTDW